MHPDSNPQQAHKRISQLFNFLEAVNQLQNTPVRHLEEQEWVLWMNDLPEHSSISRIVTYEANEEECEYLGAPPINENSDVVILRVKRPHLTAPPPPPELIREWLKPGWEQPNSKPEIISPRETENFSDDPSRVEALTNWRTSRETWTLKEKVTIAARERFAKLYALRDQFLRDSEKLELVLGDGILYWEHPEGTIYHPILLQRVELKFDSTVPEIQIIQRSFPPELYSGIFTSIPEIEGKTIAWARDELQSNDYHPLGGEKTTTFFKNLITRLSVNGDLVDRNALKEGKGPRICRNPVLFLRRRILGFTTAIQAVKEDLLERQDFPSSLLNIVGIESIQNLEGEPSKSVKVFPGEDPNILFCKPANAEQHEIAYRLEKYHAVLVQGPPGTGKTHTIGNLIGHLLAQGKNILVTSHTAKALRVVKEQVVPELQPLCISLLDNDAESQQQLKTSVTRIVEKLTSSDAEQMDTKADLLAQKRNAIITQVQALREKILQVRTSEYRDLVINGHAFTPSEASRIVAQGIGKHDWIPGPISPIDSPLPISLNEIDELYQMNALLSDLDEFDLKYPLPNPEQLLAPLDMANTVTQMLKLEGENMRLRADLWKNPPEQQDTGKLHQIKELLRLALEPLEEASSWKLEVLEASLIGEAYRKPWEELLQEIEDIQEIAESAQSLLFKYGPALPENFDLLSSERILEEIIKDLEHGGSIVFFPLLFHPSRRRFIENARTNGRAPQTIEEFKALQFLNRLLLARRELLLRWERQVSRISGPTVEELGDSPERTCAQYARQITTCLNWQDKIWQPAITQLKELGFEWETFIQGITTIFNNHAQLLRIREAIPELCNLLEKRCKYTEWHHLEEGFNVQINGLSLLSSTVSKRLQDALTQKDPLLYQSTFERLVELWQKQRILDQRKQWINKIDAVAPNWAAAIQGRSGVHGKAKTPGSPEEAWLWRQLNSLLNEREGEDLFALQAKAEELTKQLQNLTAQLIDARTWAAQMRRTNLSQRQALAGWQQTINRIGKGTGKRVPILQAEARKQMNQCQSAIPVWIMPLARVVENFDFKTAVFDVVIIDEASQCDVMALLALYLGKQVVIVGDDQQVSPEAIGQKMDEIGHLISEHLELIPNSHLFDGKMSIYDLALASFGGAICLLEHFRCVPDIIQFSNYLSYDGRLKSLRDASTICIKPSVIAHRVEGTSQDKVNHVEARTIASLIASMIEQPEYQKNYRGSPASIGVISLVGMEQAMHVESILRTYIPIQEYDRRRILCGTSAQFQGDERDIIFLSMVDGPGEGPLALRERALFQKRFNVAASRGRDQMVVVHSLSAEIDLKPGDLRRRLLEHAMNPTAISEEYETLEKHTESEFERLVLKQLLSNGFQVVPQWKVGHYRIDLVVEGKAGRLAIECDGDKYHTDENLWEDMQRQAILERLGWRFVRIRGSKFFRNPDEAMKPVYSRLDELGIQPIQHSETLVPDEELWQRITRRAAEILRQWDNEPQQLAEPGGNNRFKRKNEKDNSKKKEKPPTPDQDKQPNPKDDFTKKGYEVIDQRLQNGFLWVVGDRSLEKDMEEFKKQGIRFSYCEFGDKVTRSRAAWWTTWHGELL